MMNWHTAGPGWGSLLLLTLMMLAFWALLIFGGLAAFRSARHGGTTGPAGRGDAEALLAERFARGEIDADAYRRDCGLLRSSE